MIMTRHREYNTLLMWNSMEDGIETTGNAQKISYLDLDMSYLMPVVPY